MQYLRTNTATRITVGPFLDKTDGITPETGLTVTNEKLTFVVDDGGVPTLVLDTAPTASGGSNDMVHITNDDAGFYDLELAAANVNYLGRARLALTDAANHCPVFHEFMIIPAVVYDAMILGTDLLDVSMTQILGTAVSTPATAGILDVNLKNIANAAVATGSAQLGVNVVTQANIDFGALQKASLNAATPASVTGAVGSVTGNVGGNVAGSVGSIAANGIAAASIATGAITAAKFAASAIDAAAIATDAVTEIQSGLATAAALSTVAGYIDTEVAAILAAVDTEVAAIKAKTDNLPAAPAATGDIPTAAAVADAVWDEALAGHVTAGTTGKKLTDLVNADLSGVATAAALSTVAGYVDTEVAAILAAVDTEVAAIKAKTDNLPASPASTGDVPTAAAIAYAVWDEALAGHSGAGSAGLALATASSGGVDPSVLADAIWDEALSGHSTAGTAGKKLTDLTNADISGLATAANLATVDTVVDAIKLKTDNLPSDPADQSAVEAAISSAAASLATATALSTVAGYVDTEVAAIKAVTDKIDGMLALDGAVYQLTTNALENAPTGGAGTAPTVEEIDAQLASTHGSGLWGSAVAGSNQVTLTVTTAGAVAIPDVSVSVLNSTETTVLNALITDSNGRVILTLDNGTYKVRLRKASVVFTVPETLTVLGDTTATFTGAAISPTVPDAGVQTLVVIPEDSSLAFASNAVLTAVPTEINQFASTAAITHGKVTGVNYNTYFELALVKGVEYRIQGKCSGTVFLDVVITVTNDDTRNLSAY